MFKFADDNLIPSCQLHSKILILIIMWYQIKFTSYNQSQDTETKATEIYYFQRYACEEHEQIDCTCTQIIMKGGSRESNP